MADDSYGMGIPLPPDGTPVHQFPGVTRLAMERVAEILAGDLTPGILAAVAAEAQTAVAAEIPRAEAFATAFAEDWTAGTAAWTGAALFTATGGRLYGPPSGGPAIAQPVPVSAGGAARYTAELATVVAGPERFTWIGWTQNAAGTTPGNGDFLAVGLYRRPNTTVVRPVTLKDGAFIHVLTDYPAGTVFTVAATQSATASTVELLTDGGTIAASISHTKASFTPRQLGIYIGDFLGTAGDSIGPVAGALPVGDVVSRRLAPLEDDIAELQAGAGGTSLSAADTFANARLALQGQESAAAALTAAQTDYADAAGAYEPWADTAAWAAGAEPFTTNAGKLYGPAAGGNGHLGRPVPVGASGRALYRVSLTITAGGTERYVCAGWSSAAAGTRPFLTDMMALGFHVYPDGTTYATQFLNGQVDRLQVASIPAGGTYILTMGQDETQSWVEMTTATGSSVYKLHTLKTAYTPRQLALRLDDYGRGTAGDAYGPVVGRAAWVTHPQDPYTANPMGIWGIDPAGGQPFHVWLPPKFDPRRGAPLAIVPHGWGGHELAGAENYGAPGNGDWAITSALLAAGYIVANSRAEGGANAGHGYPHYPKLWRYLTDRLPVGRVVIWSTSFGGPAGLRLIADREVPNIGAWVGTFPVTNLASIHTNNDVLRDGINAAWGSLEAAQAAGGDPNLYPAAAFRGVRMRVRHSYADNTVYRADNVDALKARLDPYTDEFTVVTTTGAHGDPSNFTTLTDEIAFLNKAIGR